MMTTEMRAYGSLSRAVELRQDIALRAARSYHVSTRLRLVVVVLTTLIAILQVLILIVPLPGAAWVIRYSVAITLAATVAWFFALAHAWCCRQRLDISEANLVECLRVCAVR
jgi:hypothetical protein